MELRQTEKTKVQAADKAGMDVKSARKYARLGKMPSEVQAAHTWRTRKDPVRGTNSICGLDHRYFTLESTFPYFQS